jgi:cytosine/adenosine deaminase-related metal-dependent hydrolase
MNPYYALQSGSGAGPIFYQSRVRHQVGYGLANVLGRLARRFFLPLFSKPAVREGAKRVGKSLLSAGLQAASQSLRGEAPFGAALKEAGRKEMHGLVQEAQSRMRDIKGPTKRTAADANLPQQEGSGLGLQRKRTRLRRKDIFDRN